MKMRVAAALSILASWGINAVAQQPPVPAPPPDSYEGHLAAAKRAAGFEFPGTLARLCIAPTTAVGQNIGAADRGLWYAEPVKVFDNLYWVGTKIHSPGRCKPAKASS